MSLTLRPIRAAIVGTGMIAEVHRRAIYASGAQLHGVVGSSPEKSRAVADRWGSGVLAFDDLEQLLAADVDVIHVASPNFAHYSQATRALMAGKHVVCEKPLGLDVREAGEMAALAARSGLVATVPFVYRYHPIVREFRARQLNGELGRLLLIHGSYLQDWMLSPETSNWRTSPDRGGKSRAFADIGSHLCDMIEWVSGERLGALAATTSISFATRSAQRGESFTVSAESSGERTPVESEDIACLIGVTDHGTPVSLTVSQVSAGRKNRLWFELDGTERSACFDQEHSEFGWLGDSRGSRTIVRGSSDAASEAQRVSLLPPGHAQGYQDCFNAFVADTYDAMSGNTPEGLPTFEDGARSAQIVDTLLLAALAPALHPVRTPTSADQRSDRTGEPQPQGIADRLPHGSENPHP